MNPILSAALGSMLRFLLVGVASWLVSHGIWSDAEAKQYIEAGVLFLLAVIWSLWTHYRTRIKFLTALMPGPKTESEVKEHIKSGEPTPSVNTPPDTIPGVPKP